ncbi:helix-turn-helix domain-containing protein [Paenibacillus sp. J5C_2022]|uniref:helix-turn-helix domain-containing protein n=1 Tax=Paenibacillus sp. J5C2022 TaxID=2977129 RepID=UPI0021D250D9|nr:helix-turn-helix domain-containing protein [Paenibacillus sp. J5C2022]MCU6711318.1 helix-turn-helix domain-containing protein [Paenibacillus sp. J5C2022]
MSVHISRRIKLTYSIVLLVIIILSFGLSYIGTVGRLEKDLKDVHFALLKQIDNKIELSFRETERNLLKLMNEMEFVYFMYDSYEDESEKYTNFYSLSNKVTSVTHSNPQLTSVYVYSDVSGNILTNKVFLPSLENEEEWLVNHINMDGYIKWLPTHRIWEGAVSRDVVTLIRPYPAISKPGFRKGLVAVNIDEVLLQRMIAGIYETNYGGQTILIDQEGNVVTHSDRSQLYGNADTLPYIKQILEGGTKGEFTTDLNGTKHSVFYMNSNYTDWKIVTVIPNTDVYKPISSTRDLLILVALCMIVVALLALFYFNHKTFKPIERLAGKMFGAYRTPQPETAKSMNGLSSLETIFDQISLDREHLEQQVRDFKPVLKWRLMIDMLTGNKTEYADVGHQLEYIGIKLYPSYYMVCSAEIEKGEQLGSGDLALYTFMLCNVAEELINMEHAGIAVDLGGGKAVILISFAEGDEEQNHLRALAVLELLLKAMEREFKLSVTVGLGRCYPGMADIPESYDQSLKALQYKLLFGSDAVISIEDISTSQNQDYYRIVKKAERITEALKQSDDENVKLYVMEMFADALGSNLSPDLIRQLSYELIMKSLQMISFIGIDPEETIASLGNLHQRISACDNWHDIERIVMSVLEQIAVKIADKRSSRGKNKTVDSILSYIQEHYYESELSLDQLAKQFQLTPPYISKLFKEHTERNFIDYLIEIRIAASKQFLLDKSMKVNDVAEAVGYTNTRSFLRAFKKYTGLTPTEFREQEQLES